MKLFSQSEYKEIRALNAERTLVDSILKREFSEINLKVGRLEIYTEEQTFNDLRASFLPSRLYFLKPYDLTVDLVSSKFHKSKTNTNAKSSISVVGLNSFEIQIGLKEIGTYLLLGQGFFKFMNDVTVMQAEVDKEARQKVEEARRRQAEKLDEATNGNAKKRVSENEEAPPSNDKNQSLDEILINEGLIKFEV